ncbi:MAG: hypothetical protein QG640_513 [Patescibacteria group bacterium]|nr:hypothetical protein [Patescibacteria group bacterium]
MKNLRKLLTTPLQLQQIPKWVPVVILAIALIGFADATYLTIEHYQNEIPPCTIGGCESVLTSQYAQVAGIPVSLLGALNYLIIVTLLFLYLDTKKEIFLRVPVLLSVFGAVASIGFMYIMIFVIKAFCPYCVVSAATSLSIFAVSLWLVLKSRNLSQQVQG